MRTYIAGPMRGYVRYNFDAFDLARDFLRGKGHTPISPADIDRLFEGWGKYPPPDFDMTPEKMKEIIERDLNALKGCDAIFMLKGWQDSKGARLELAYAEFLGLTVIYEEEM